MPNVKQEEMEGPELNADYFVEDEKMFSKRDLWLFIILFVVIVISSLVSIRIAQAI
jgi:hypothetical protein